MGATAMEPIEQDPPSRVLEARVAARRGELQEGRMTTYREGVVTGALIGMALGGLLVLVLLV